MSSFINGLKSALGAVRELLLIVLVLFALIFTRTTASYVKYVEKQLYGVGLDNVKTPLGEIDLRRVVEASAGLNTAQRDVPDAAAALNKLASSLPPAAQAQAMKIATSLESSAAALQAPSKLLDTAAQSGIEKQAPLSSPEGWIYVGHVDESRRNWMPNPTIVGTSSPTFNTGDIVTITDDVYIRANSDASRHNQASVVGAVRAGEKVRVIGKDYTHALRGGWFMWLQVAAS